ncbi:MAG: histone deacetylase [Methanoculleus sp.]|jgi:acetoin utilization deacetylase AcuC-like enzyme
MRSSVIYGDIFTRHDMEAHPESAARLRTALSGVPDNIPWRPPVRATEEDLERVHLPQYVRWVRELARGTCFLDLNTYVTCHSFDAAAYAAGSTFAAVERALDGEHLFALVRPPGHHAEPDRAMGFCIFNNAAVAAAKALREVDRVAILDWDLHHGNGTQTAFYGSDRVLYCSVHEENSFPKTGWVDEIGTGAGRGYTLNAPLAPGSTIADYAQVFDEVFIPALTRFRPDALIISAGQDALADDEHGRMNLVPEDYGVLTGMLIDGTDLPLALTLEGGYGPSIGKAIAAIFRALAGKRFEPGEQPLHESTRKVVELLKKVRFY